MFSTPEYRQLTYAELGPDDLQNQVKVTDAQVKQAYDLQKDKYIIPDRRPKPRAPRSTPARRLKMLRRSSISRYPR
jgi:hypothetical protein